MSLLDFSCCPIGRLYERNFNKVFLFYISIKIIIIIIIIIISISISISIITIFQGRLPVKWTAYEALLYGTYTTQSDV